MMGRSSLGTDMVTGKKRVPRPAAGITALRIFMTTNEGEPNPNLAPVLTPAYGSHNERDPLTRPLPQSYHDTKAVLNGELAVPCIRNPL